MTIRKRNIGLKKQNADGLFIQTQLLRRWTFALILFISLISCKNVKTESSCGFEFFEKTSGFKFPKNILIIDCYDSLEGMIWVHLEFDPKTASEFIIQNEMHQYSDKIENELFKLHGSEDDQMIKSLTTFMNDSIQPITKNQHTYLKTIKREHQYVIYIINKNSGYFWGLIQYPDWGGE
ncbi:MAG: hypothetical protein ABJD66_08880 [Cellulophaga sp.]|uniref:hypothetical protein n=1 Tax=unclassified Cellulophaga TaxID=2634405 RepID=UPI000CB6073D|nr:MULTISPECIES: hypothetical protein [unclassified Cellulophaga]MDO6490194.1 hypothetical protein [Cellulophaga sp. 2_MG-2023]MDO6494612.1 hypothetical protein [Cellulophaga sp. 3_MG-2023]PKB42200.1 hypothetical protein AX016_0362 [Cellulophaga sp. RHA19]